MTLGLLLLIAGVLKAQPYINGPLTTGATSSGGVAAPAGFTWSELQGANTGYGSGANIGAGYTLADDFTVPAGQTWNITKFTFYAYSTGATGSTSPFNDTRVRIFNTNPSSGSPTPVFGDLTTNRFAASTTASMYRIAAGAEGTTRQIWKIEATVATSLAAGTYWVEWQHGTVVANASNFSPAKTVPGTTTQAGNNALQHDLNAGTWVAITDVGPQDFPFQIDYTATGTPCSGTPAPGNTISTATSVCPNIPFTLSVQNATTGLGVTYQWQSAPAATGPWTNITGATNATYTVTNLTTATFYQLVVNCSNSGATGTSTPVQVSATPSTGCYCTPANSDCSDGDIITNVTFGALNNTSTCSGTGYTNYTTNSAITIPTAIIGATNPITITAGSGTYTESVGVWIDYNHSGSFEASEFTLIGTAATPIVRNGNIVIPATALTGNTRMRVRVQFLSAVAGGGACTTSYLGYGETEDYTVNLVPCTPVTLTAQPVSKTIDCGTNTTFSVTTAGSLPVVYWEYRTSATALWQNVPAAAPYSGVNTTTLTITGATSAINGYQYRAVYSGACTAVDFSTVATLTVSPLVGTVNPASASICLGSIQKLSITNTQPATVVTFSSAPALNITIPDDASTTGVNNTIAVSGIPAGVTITNIKIKMNITHSWAGDLIVVAKAPNTNKVLNLAYALTATGGTAVTTSFNPTYALSGSNSGYAGATGNLSTTYPGTYVPDGFNTLTGAPTVPTGPDGFLPTSTNSGPATDPFTYLFDPGTQASTAVNGNWTLALYDYYDDFTTTNKFNNWSIEITYTGGLATGVWTSPTPNSLYTDAAATVPYNGTSSVNTVYAKPTTAGVTNYTVVVNNGTCTSAPLTVPVTVNAPATAVTAVADKAICPGGNTSFTATATGGFGTTSQWQISTDGGATYTNIANGGIYSGATTNTLTLTGVPESLSGAKYRLVAVAAPCLAGTNLASAAGTLTVNPAPVVVLGAGPTTAVYPGITTSLTAAVSPSAAASYQWTLDGSVITGQTTNTITGITVDQLGTYAVKVVDVNGCSGTSNSITLSDSATATLFIYPNPAASGQFHVRFYDAPGGQNFLGKRTLTIFDNKGSKVLTKEFTGVSPYTDMFIDLKNHAKGVYGVDVLDAKGNRLKTGQVIVQ